MLWRQLYVNVEVSMIAIDTNVLVRILINDPDAPDQNHLARTLAKNAGQLFISQIVQIETVWILQSAYEFEKNQVITVLKAMLTTQAMVLQRAERFALALDQFANSNAGFADCLILTESQQEQLLLWTFDRKLGKLQGANRLTVDTLKSL